MEYPGTVRLLVHRGAPALALALLVGIAAGIEIGLALPLSGWLYALLAALGALAVWSTGRRDGRRPDLRAWVVFVAVLAVLERVPWTPRKAFLRDLERVRPGMRVEQAAELMRRHPEAAPATEAVRVYRHSHAPRFDSDRGLVYTRDGRVTRVVFLPD